jgi:hypothetical protein
MDIIASCCDMRTTIDLPADLHHMGTSIAAHTRRSMNQTVADLTRRGLAVAPPIETLPLCMHCGPFESATAQACP